MTSRNFSHKSAATALFFLLAGGCGDLSEELPKNQTPLGQHGRITNTQESGGAIATQVNATDAMAWVYFQFATGTEVTPQAPQNSTDWDLAVQRFQIKINGGMSGSAGAEATVVEGVTFDGMTQAPQASYITDQPDSADDDPDPDYAFAKLGPWYTYNVMTHLLTPKDQVYVLRSATGTYYKMQMTAYYDKAGSSGYPTFRWKAVTAP